MARLHREHLRARPERPAIPAGGRAAGTQLPGEVHGGEGGGVGGAGAGRGAEHYHVGVAWVRVLLRV